MKRIFLIIYLLLGLAAYCPGRVSDEIDLDSLVSVWKRQTVAGDFDSVVMSGTAVCKAAVSSGDTYARLYSSLYTAQAYYSAGQHDSAFIWLSSVENEVLSSNDGHLTMMLYNMKAILSMSLEMDYASCSEYFSKALDVARKTGASANERSILCNLASVYYAREDTAGISYARQAYELSKEADDMYTLPPSIVYLIRMLMMQEKYDQAMSYMDELRTYYESSHVRQYGYMLYLLTADIKNSTGHYAEAEYYYKKALDLSTGVTSSSLLSGYRNYGSYLLDRGRVNEAGVVLRKGLELSREHGCMEPMGEFLLGLAEVSELSGDKSRAYDYYQQYHAYEEWKNISERRFNQLLLMFHTVRYQQEMTLKDQALLRNQKRIIIVVSFSVILSVVLVGVYMMYRKKNRMYRRMVENHYKLSQELARAVEKINAAEKNRADRTPDDILYDRIEYLMRQEKVYRQKDISLEKLSSMLDTNRTYVSNTINAKSGRTFYNYLNGYRIAEAVSVLSSVDDDTPLKVLCEDLGFNSMSVFYRAFQKETGVPPSRYREEVRRIKLSS